MIRFLLITLFFAVNFFAQDKVRVDIKQITQKTDSFKKVEMKPVEKMDTTKIVISNNPSIVSLDPVKQTKIVLVKEDNIGPDWAKYIIPILTLLLGIGINRYIDFINNRKRIKKTGERWVIELMSLKEPIEDQIKELTDFETKLSTQDFAPPTLSAMTAINGDVFKSLDKNELFKYIELKTRKPWYKFPDKKIRETESKDIIRTSNRTHGFISILTHQFSMIQERYNAYLSGTSLHTTSLSKDLQKFLAELRTFNLSFEASGADITKNLVTAPVDRLFMLYIQPHIQDGNYNPFVLRDKFFMPLNDHLVQYRSDPRTIPLLNAVTDCLNDIAGIKSERIYIIKNVNILRTNYKKLKDDLPLLISEITGKDIENISFIPTRDN